MSGLNWSEQQAVDELAGALVSVAALIAHRPNVADQVRAAVVEKFGDDEKALIGKLAQMVEDAEAEEASRLAEARANVAERRRSLWRQR